MQKRGRINWLVIILVILTIIWSIGYYQLKVQATEKNVFEESILIRATYYTDEGITASGKQTRPGIIASRQEYLGYVACINAMNEDGSIGEFIGFYEILDTGYGRELGYGESKIIPGRTLGSIEAGESIDIFMPTQHEADEWLSNYGDYVYIKLVKGEG